MKTYSEKIIKGDLKKVFRNFLLMSALMVVSVLAVTQMMTHPHTLVRIGCAVLYVICMRFYAKTMYEEDAIVAQLIYMMSDHKAMQIIKEEKNLYNEVQIKDRMMEMFNTSEGRKEFTEFIIKGYKEVNEELAERLKKL